MSKLTKKIPRFLLVNPPIYDFAAHDLWLKPLGLLYIAAMLKNAGAAVELIDCLDRNHPLVVNPGSNEFGSGKYYAEACPKPALYKDIPRVYKRHGLSGDALRAALKNAVAPDLVLVSSGMTYWYPGVQEAITSIKEIFPGAPVVLGGIYATLCKDHAEKHSGADFVIPGNRLAPLGIIIEKLLKYKIEFPGSFADFPAPANEFYSNAKYAVTRTSLGCPFNCSYCAQKELSGAEIQTKSRAAIVSEILGIASKGIKNIAFYDDALLFDPERHIIPLLREIVKRRFDLQFHTPNGIHSKFISRELAILMRSSGFVMPRISLETTDLERQITTGAKVTNAEFASASDNLKEAGYKPGEFIVYLLLGMPGQALSEVENSIRFAHACGAKISLSEYSPIPHTGDWVKIKEQLPADDPLWHNNSIHPLFKSGERLAINKIKQFAKEVNNCFT